ncbi:ABC transporter permease [Kineococcus radiotolerans]|uniref:ABC3 transporter permease C-terminal domain-containing protein n=1 Tax=Kineococcus radiotolerans (strain ATCC BAA-149 / DSM 14245 / SRS30216) TaxID=266940 RepID=A6WGC4_KINRD|nr:ABC transporter permease [Kineococcus radiotolerans]ABS05863.1 protein of unknown function DUF214 [Kineococcus radiotolerans SRS30216 = ATCC BAA-149]
MLRLCLTLLRHRIPAMVAVACALFGAALLLTATGVLAETGVRSHLPVGRLAAADVVVSAEQSLPTAEDVDVALPERVGVPAALADRLAQVPGVRAAVADVSFPLAVVGPGGRVVATSGHGESSAARSGDALPALDGDRVALAADVAAAAGVRVGDEVTLRVAGRDRPARVAALAAAPATGVLLDDAAVEAVAGPGRADLVGVRVEDGRADEVAAAVRTLLAREDAGSRFVVATGAARGDATLPSAGAQRGTLVVLASSMGGVPLVVVGLVVAGALGTVVATQRRDLALLRAVGTTPRQVRSLVAGQATLVGTAAALPGILLGYLLAGRSLDLLAAGGLVPPDLPLALSPLPALAALLVVALIAQGAGRWAARGTSRAPLAEVLAESTSGPRTPSRPRTLVGLVLVAASIPLAAPPLFSGTLDAAAGTALAGMVAAVGIALAGPDLLRRGSELLVRRGGFRRGSAHRSVTSWLAVQNLRGNLVRSAGTTTALTATVVFALTYTLTQTTVLAAATRDTAAATAGTRTVTAVGGVGDDLLDAVTAVPGVRAAAVGDTSVVLGRTVLGEPEVEAEPALVLGPGAGRVLDLGVTDGTLDDLTGSTAALGEAAARFLRVGVGSSVPLRLGDGTETTVRVVAVHSRGGGLGEVALPADLVRDHTSGRLPDRLLVRTDGAAADRALAAVLRNRPGVELAGTTTSIAVPANTVLNFAVLGILVAYLLLGVVNTLVASTTARRGEFEALRHAGATPGQVRVAVRRENVWLAAAAVLAGIAVSVVPLALLGVGFLGRPWAAGPWWFPVATVAVVVAVALPAVELSARRTLRRA